MLEIQIINGPNLNLLGRREKEIYGSESFESFFNALKVRYPEIKFNYFQSNIEGELIQKLHDVGFSEARIILNAGAYTHTSIGIADAVAGISSPVIEVHISNVFAREEFRHVSLMGKHCVGSISGFGLMSYDLAIEAFLRRKANNL